MIRVGLGYDVHKFSEQTGDYNVKLGGVSIPSKKFIIAHSDGDVLLHALTDALLGAIAQGDIGDHFPPTDDKWKDVSSDLFVKHSLSLLEEMNGELNNVDITVICETPKLMNYKKEMKYNIAQILKISHTQVNVKATTTEKLGFTGRKEGIAVQAICAVDIKETRDKNE